MTAPTLPRISSTSCGGADTGQPAEHLVRADRVQCGEPVKEQDGDPHGAPWVAG
jgi:hypothetical protein